MSSYRYYILLLTAPILFWIILFCQPVEAKKVKPVEVALPVVEYEFVEYNNPPGTKELDLHKLKEKKQLNLNGVVSPDKTTMVYSEVYFYPDNSQTNCALYQIKLDTSLSGADRILKATIADKKELPLMTSGMDSYDNHIYRTLTVVDWSEDSSRLLVKEKTGEDQRSLWATNVWVYDFDTDKATRLDKLRTAIKDFWKTRTGVYLDDYKWDITPIGWDLNYPDRIIVYAYGYNKELKKFLGAWSIDYQGRDVSLESLVSQNFGQDFEVSRNGLVLKVKGRD